MTSNPTDKLQWRIRAGVRFAAVFCGANAAVEYTHDKRIEAFLWGLAFLVLFSGPIWFSRIARNGNSSPD